MGNIALNRPTASSSYVMPYAPSRAVDGQYGTTTPTNRWLCNTLPGWMSVNLGTRYLVNRWVVRHMPLAGWQSPNFVNADFKLQGSNDNTTWYDIDTVVGNTTGITDRTFASAALFQFYRVYVTKGLNCNNKMASIMELEIYQAYSSLLTNLAISSGALTPAFTSGTFAYSATVGPDVASINITPTAKDPQAIIKINNVISPSGQPKSVALSYGVNNIVVNVTAGDGSQSNYTIAVTRQGDADLKTLTAQDNLGANVPLNPSFDKGITAYTAKIDYDASAIAYIPTTDDAQATIKLDGTSTPNGSLSGATTVGTGITSSLEVTATAGNKKTYSVAVSKHTSAYLISVTLAGGRTQPSWNTPFARKTFNYAITAYATPLNATIVKEDAAATLLVTCNGTTLSPASSSGNTAVYSVALNAGSNTLVVKVTSTTGDVKTYTLTINK